MWFGHELAFSLKIAIFKSIISINSAANWSTCVDFGFDFIVTTNGAVLANLPYGSS